MISLDSSRKMVKLCLPSPIKTVPKMNVLFLELLYANISAPRALSILRGTVDFVRRSHVNFMCCPVPYWCIGKGSSLKKTISQIYIPYTGRF